MNENPSQPDSGAAARGDWLFRCVPRYNKPILCYWLALGSTRIPGMNQPALRLPSALCGVFTVLMTMAIATRMRGRRVARIAGVVTARRSISCSRRARWRLPTPVRGAAGRCDVGHPACASDVPCVGHPGSAGHARRLLLRGEGGHHVLGRTVRPYEGHSGWPGNYVVAPIVAFFPWGSLVPAAIHEGWRQRGDPTVEFLLAWVVGPLVLVELTTSKLPHYMLVTFPALAILVAMLIEARVSGAREWTRAERMIEAAIFAAICLALASAGLCVAGIFNALPIRLTAWGLSVAALAAAATCAFVVATRRHAQLVSLLAVSAAALYLLVFVALLPALEPQGLAPVLGEVVARRLGPDERLVLCKVGEASVGYYLQRRPDVVGGPDAVKAALGSDTRYALFLLPDDDRGLHVDPQAGDRARRETLETVQGVILPNPSPRRILIARRTRGPPPGPRVVANIHDFYQAVCRSY